MLTCTDTWSARGKRPLSYAVVCVCECKPLLVCACQSVRMCSRVCLYFALSHLTGYVKPRGEWEAVPVSGM